MTVGLHNLDALLKINIPKSHWKARNLEKDKLKNISKSVISTLNKKVLRKERNLLVDEFIRTN